MTSNVDDGVESKAMRDGYCHALLAAEREP